jgi:murein DD-endopeptidase MepM/ murein hydrolase activator NlpD
VPQSRHIRLVVLAVPAAIFVLLWATVRAAPLAPIGHVRGAVASGPEALVTNRRVVVEPAFIYARTTDPDAPASVAGRLPPPPSTLTGYIWPLAHGRITLPFKAIPGGTRINDGRLWHDGLDMATFCGDRVRAAHDGVVLAAGRHFDDVVGWVGDLSHYYSLLDRKSMWKDLPLVVVIDDGNGYRSIYAHFGEIVVRKGDVVHAGQQIGYEGMTGHASGCHVHFGLFSPRETKTFGVRADLLRKLRLPRLEIARIDPLLVLPNGAEALRTRQIPRPGATIAPSEDRASASGHAPVATGN